jgi:hypothetical protein
VENASSAEGSRSRRRLGCVRTTAGIGSASGDVRGARGEWAATALAARRKHFRIVASRRSRSARFAQFDTADDTHVASPHVVARPAWDRGAAAARRIPPTLSGGLDVTQNAPQRFLPAAAPIRLQRSSHLVAEPIGHRRPDDPSRRRLRQDTPRRDVFAPPRSGGGSRRAAAAPARRRFGHAVFMRWLLLS